MVEVNLDRLVMANPKRVAFGLSLASSSSELVNASMTSFESCPGISQCWLPSY